MGFIGGKVSKENFAVLPKGEVVLSLKETENFLKIVTENIKNKPSISVIPELKRSE